MARKVYIAEAFEMHCWLFTPVYLIRFEKYTLLTDTYR